MSVSTLHDGQLDNAIMFPLASLPGNPDTLSPNTASKLELKWRGSSRDEDHSMMRL